MVSHPDPIYKPDLLPKRTNSEGCNDNGGNIDGSMIGIRDKKSEQDCDFIRPNCSFQLPTLLLESALEMAGGHLGSVWMCPDTSNTKIFSFRDFSKPTESSKIEEFDVDMCSRPIQLAKIVDETSLLYQNGGGEDIGLIDAKSGVQVSVSFKKKVFHQKHKHIYLLILMKHESIISNIIILTLYCSVQHNQSVEISKHRFATQSRSEEVLSLDPTTILSYRNHKIQKDF